MANINYAQSSPLPLVTNEHKTLYPELQIMCFEETNIPIGFYCHLQCFFFIIIINFHKAIAFFQILF